MRDDRAKLTEPERELRRELQKRARQIAMLDHFQDHEQQQRLMRRQTLRAVDSQLAERR